MRKSGTMRMQSALSICTVMLGLITWSPTATAAQATRPPTKRCVSTSVTIDSSFAVRAASAALQAQDSLGPFKPAKIRAFEEGFLVSLVVAKEPPTLGGGGLVWVDGDSGCAVILRLYE
jgi:hypothetical protein